jgi:hypothetical protein
MKNLKSIDSFLNEDLKDQDSFNEEEVTNAIRFAIEKFTNYHQAMSRQEAAATFVEWKEKGEYYDEAP